MRVGGDVVRICVGRRNDLFGKNGPNGVARSNRLDGATPFGVFEAFAAVEIAELLVFPTRVRRRT